MNSERRQTGQQLSAKTARTQLTELPAGIGTTALTAIQMLLAGTHTDLIEPDWPEEVLEFMGDSSVGNDQLPPPTSY